MSKKLLESSQAVSISDNNNKSMGPWDHLLDTTWDLRTMKMRGQMYYGRKMSVASESRA